MTPSAPPKHEDGEQTLADVRERIKKTIAFAESEREGAAIRRHRRPNRQDVMGGRQDHPQPGPRARNHDLERLFPPVDSLRILRHNGVDVGKMAFLGRITCVEG